jgi:hypothetical protein
MCHDAPVPPPPPAWFRLTLLVSGVAMLAYQSLLPEPVATLIASPLAALVTDRQLLTPPDADAALMLAIPLLVGAMLAWTAVRRRAGVPAILWRGAAGAVSSLLVMIWTSFLVPSMWPTAAVLLAGAAVSAWGIRFERFDTGGMGAVLVFVAATATSHFFVPLSAIAGGNSRPVLIGLAVAAVVVVLMRLRPFSWHAPPRFAQGFAALCCAASAIPIAGYFSVDQSVYGCDREDPSLCPYDDPAFTWLERDTEEVYYSVHLDPPRQQVVALARARYCDDGTTATAAFFGLEGGELGRVPIPDCDRAYGAGRPDADRLLPVCASGLQQLDLESRSLTTPPLERFTDFEVETAIERPDGSWFLSGVDQGLVARFDPTTLQEVERFWAADAVHVVTRVKALDFIEPGLFLHQSTTVVQVLDDDFNVRARRETFGANVFSSVDERRQRLYVPDTARQLLRVWTLPELEEVAQVPIRNGAYVAYHSSELGLQAIANFGGSTVDLYDADTLERRGTLEVGPGPRGGVFEPTTRRLIGTSRCGVFSVDLDAALSQAD